MSGDIPSVAKAAVCRVNFMAGLKSCPFEWIVQLRMLR